MTSVLAPPWIELCITRDGTGAVSVSAHGEHDTRVEPRPLGIDFDRLVQFAQSVATLAQNQTKPVQGKLAEEARAIHGAVFRDKIANRCTELQASAKQPLLVRFVVTDPDLQKVPWEALCAPEEGLGYLGTSPKYLPVRAVSSGESWQRREPSGALHVLAISPNDASSSQHWKSAFQDRIDSGEVKWLEPLVGSDARVKSVLTRIRDQNPLHVIHYRGHGGLDKNNNPSLQMAGDGEDQWLAVELLAQELASKSVSLVVLESCNGAQPSVFASAAEILARNNVTAVLAHSWRVYADHARTLSTEFYKALCASGDYVGNAAWAANVARRMVLADNDNSVCALSSVLYLRGNDARVISFHGRVDKAVATSRSKKNAQAGMTPGEQLARDIQKRRAKLAALLQANVSVCKEIANRLGVEASTNANAVVNELLSQDASPVAEALEAYAASKECSAVQRELIYEILWLALPVIVPLQDLIHQAKVAAGTDGKQPIVLPVEYLLTTEIILARIDERACDVIVDNDLPQGMDRVPVPSTEFAPFFDGQGEVALAAIAKNMRRRHHSDLKAHFLPKIEAMKKGGSLDMQNRYRALVKKLAEALDRRLEKEAENEQTPRRSYVTFIDAEMLDGSNEDLDVRWGKLVAALAENIPSLRVVRIKGSQDFEKENDTYESIQSMLVNKE